MLALFLPLISPERDLTGPALIQKMRQAVRQACPIKATVERRYPGYPKMTTRSTFQSMYPHRLSLSMGPMEIHWTGDAFYMYSAETKAYTKDSEPNFMMPPELMLLGFENSFSDKEIYSDIGKPKKTKFNGKDAYAVQAVTPEQAGPAYNTFYIDSKTFLPLGYDQALYKKSAVPDGMTVYMNVVTHAKLTKKDFDWEPPKGSKQSKP